MEYEYGWNDPPSFSYSATSSASAGKLSKRPSYPPSNDITTTSSTATPPPPQLVAPPTTSTFYTGADATKKTTLEPKEEIAKNHGVYDNADFSEVIQKLNNLTDNVREKLKEKLHDDIKRRLNLLSVQMKNDKLSSAVMLKTGRLVAALDQQDYNTADTLQVSLMVDHVSEVSQWLVAIKKLISTLRSEP